MIIKTYESLAAFFEQENFSEGVGDYVQTLGFDTAGDGGAAMFKVISVSDAIISTQLEINRRTFVRGNYTLELIPENNTVYVEQFGAKGNVDFDSLTDDEKSALANANKVAIETALFAAPVVAFSPKEYETSGNIAVPLSVWILGNNATVFHYAPNDGDSMFILSTDTHDLYHSIEISDIYLYGGYGELDFTTERNIVSIFNAENVRFENVHFCGATYAIFAAKENDESDKIDNITFSNCTAESVCNGLYFKDATNVKIRNFRIEHADPDVYFEAATGIGLKLEGNCFGANVEDLSVFNSPSYAVAIENGVWDNDATNSIFFKNLLIDGVTGTAICIQENNIPVRFANAMVVNTRIGILLRSTENVDVINSSLTVSDSTGWMMTVVSYAKAKFTKTQFEFPANFQKYNQGSVSNETAELTFVDCTLQKTDMGDDATGFGTLGYTGNYNNAVVQTFDACEFRSYQKDFATFNSDGTITNYKPAITLATKTVTNDDTDTEKSSKIIIKNCRFVNDALCNAPYFMLNDSKAYDNIVVYNCFFENYTPKVWVVTDVENNKGEWRDSTEHPFFAKVTDGVAVVDSTGHNVFAKCNMRSSTPVRGAGTTICETKEYQ